MSPEKEKARKAAGRNAGDLDDLVGLESRLAKVTEERDVARQLAVKATNELLDIRAQLDCATSLRTPSKELLLEYAEAKRTLVEEQRVRKEQMQKDHLSQARSSFHDAVKNCLVLSRAIADTLIGESS